METRRSLAMQRLARATAIAFALATGITCGKDSTAPDPVATKLAIETALANVVAGVPMALQLRLTDDAGATVTSASGSVSVAIATGTGVAGATLSGTLTVTAAAGVATFTGLSIDKAGAGYQLTVTATGLTSVTSPVFAVSPGAAAKLAVTTQPTNTAAGAAVSPGVQVTIQDALSNTVTTATTSVTIAITSGTGAAGAALGGTATAPAASGVATFSTLTIDKAASGYTLSATAAGLTSATSNAITVSPGAAAKLAIAVQPAGVVAGAVISPGIQVAVQDAFSNPIPTASNSIAIAITSGTGAAGATLGGTVSKAASSGVATFTDLAISKAGTGYTLSATATGLTTAVTTAFDISVGAAAKLAFTVNASNSVAATSIAPSIQVAVQDAQGNTVTGATNSITLAIATDPSGVTAVLSGTKTVAAVSGIASFSGLSINKAATGFVLSAAATGLTSTTGSTFNITAGAATQLQRVSAGHGQTAVVGTKVTIAPSVTVYDANFNTVPGASVTFAVTSGGGSLDALAATSNASGIATPGNWTLGPAAGQNEFTAILTGPIGTSVTFAATAHGGAATQMAVNAGNNETAVVGETIQISPSVIVKDANGIPVGAGTTVTWAIGSGGGQITEATGVTSSGGIATVGSWTMSTTAGVHTLTATSTGLTGSPVTFTATATAGNATQIAINAGNGQTAVAGSAVTTVPTVIVKDVHNNPKSGVTVTFTPGIGGGSRTNATAATNASGIASVGGWTLGTTAGTNTLTATVTGLTGSPVTFSATGTAGAPASILFNAGSSLSFVSASVTTPPSVKVVDANNNGVSGVDVTFAITGGAGSFTGSAIRTTNASGVAALSDWTMGGTEVANTLTATSGSLTGSPVQFSVDMFKQVAVSTEATCGVTTGGKMYCFGSDAEGLLGNGSASSATQTSPVAVAGGLTFATTVGKLTMNKLACGLTAAGAAYCWGLDSYGAAGHGGATGTTLTSPTAVTGSLAFNMISTGAQHTCGVTVTTGLGYCWGTGSDGQIGDGAGTRRLSPTLVSGSHTFTTIGAGTAHSCGLDSGGAAWCWGSNVLGQLGTGSATPSSETAPVAVTGGLVFTALSVGANHSCGITNASRIKCWGSGSNGQIGVNSTANALSPTEPFLGVHTATSAAAGGNSTCVTFASGIPYCWGAHSNGQLGTGGTNTDKLDPASMPGDPILTRISVGSDRSCGIKGGLRLYCWGLNSIGQNGDGTTTTTNTPTAVILP